MAEAAAGDADPPLAAQFDGWHAHRDCCGVPETIFRVRRGPDYARQKKKAPSAPALYDVVGMDVFSTPSKVYHIASKLKLPPLDDSQRIVSDVPPYFVLNVQLPGYEPNNPLWGQARDNGPGWSVVVYYVLRPATRAQLQNLDTATAAVKLLRNFMLQDDLKVRFKAMGNWLNADSVEMGLITKRLLVEYNQRPVLTRPQHAFFSDNATYFEADVDVHIFGYLPRKSFHVLRPYMKQMIWDVGLTIEGHSDEELPETILGVVHLHNVTLDKARELDFDTLPTVDNATLCYAEGGSVAGAPLSQAVAEISIAEADDREEIEVANTDDGGGNDNDDDDDDGSGSDVFEDCDEDD